MKLTILLTCLLGVAAVLEPAGREDRVMLSGKWTPRTSVAHARTVPARAGHPDGYETSAARPSHHRSKAALLRVPVEPTRPTLRSRRENLGALRKPQSRVTASDFFECTNSNPSPSTADCDVIVAQVLSSSDEVIITANSCLVFSYRTCQGFFCSLCQTMTTTTDFIGNELDTVDALCVENGQVGTIVGEDPPQWDAGFTYSGQGLPTFDVC